VTGTPDSLAPDGVKPDVAGFVLSGGRSSRMGRDKAFVQLGGQHLILHALGVLRAARLPVFVVGGSPALANYAPLIPDRETGRGPLSGICAALSSTYSPWAVFLPVDLPFVPPSLVRALLQHAYGTGLPVTVPSLHGFAQTFPAVVLRAVLPALLAQLDADRRACFAGFQVAAAALDHRVSIVPVENLLQTGSIEDPFDLPPFRWFLNLNTESDVRRAEAQLPAFPGAAENRASIA